MDTTWHDDVVLQGLSLAELAADAAQHQEDYSVPQIVHESGRVSFVEIVHMSGQSYTFRGIKAQGFMLRLRAALAFLG